MKKKKDMFNVGMIFLSPIMKFFLYFIALLPPAFILLWSIKTNFFIFAAAIFIAVFLFMFDLIIIIKIFLCFIPDVKPGRYKIYSKKASLFILRGMIYQILISEPLFGYIMGDILLTNIFFRVFGIDAKGIFVVGENTTRILDPWLTEIGNKAIK
jgi:hypothetical protein